MPTRRTRIADTSCGPLWQLRGISGFDFARRIAELVEDPAARRWLDEGGFA